jgi:hypothetical protein
MSGHTWDLSLRVQVVIVGLVVVIVARARYCHQESIEDPKGIQ